MGNSSKVKQLRICERVWEVKFLPTVLDDDDNGAKGTTDEESQVIEVSNKLAGDAQRSTLLHEALHAAIKTSLNSHPDDEEKCVQGLETALYSMLRCKKNKWFWKYMMEDDD